MQPSSRLALCLSACAALVLAPAAQGARSPKAAERTAITQAFRAYNATSDFQAVREARVRRIAVSTAVASWARVDAAAKGLDDSELILSKRQGTWRVLSQGTAQVSCGVGAPAVVRRDLFPADRCQPPRQSFRGRSSDGVMSFNVSTNGRYVVGFRFVNRCPADSVRGTLAPVRIRLRKGPGSHRTFSYRDEQFTIAGRFESPNVVTGTARDHTGDCDSGTLRFRATKRQPA